MSTIIMSHCWPMVGMSPAQKAVLISLADQANDDGYCWPSVGTIAKRTCLSERAVQGAIKWLQSAGLLSSDERRGTSSVYRITPAAYAPPQEMRPADAAPRGAGNAPPPPQMLRPTPADAAPKPSLNRQLNRKEPKDTRADATGFEAFWECWPQNERKQDKAKCSEKWKRDSLDTVADSIVGDVTAKKHSQKWRDGFIEAPMVYLNNRRWEDGAASATAGPKRGTDEYAALHKSAGWWREAGFPTIWDAMASKCWHTNADQFRDGQRIKEAA